MKNLKTLFTILLAATALLFISCGKAKTDAYGCYYDFDEATAVANKKNQDIMVIITLDGDDDQSTDFMNKVVRDSKFKDEIASKYAVVCMDFSQKSYEATVAAEDADAAAKKAAEENASRMQKNTRVATILNATETPVIFLLSKEQYLINGLFYDDENRTLDGFKEAIAAKASSIDDMHKMIYQTKIGTAEEKIAAIDALFEATSPSYRLLLLDLIDSVKSLDPTNKSGLVGKYVYEAAAAKSDKALIDGDVKTAVQYFIDVAEEEYVPAESKQQALYTAAYMSSMAELEEIPVVISYLEKSIQYAPDSEDVPAIKRVIAALQEQQNQTE